MLRYGVECSRVAASLLTTIPRTLLDLVWDMDERLRFSVPDCELAGVQSGAGRTCWGTSRVESRLTIRRQTFGD